MAEKLVEVFKTPCGAVFQSNRFHHYVMEFGGRPTIFKVRDFFHFCKEVEAINLEEMAHNPSRTADVVILMPHFTDRCFVLTLQDVLNLKELLHGAKFMINLNSMVSECLRVNLASPYLD